MPLQDAIEATLKVYKDSGGIVDLNDPSSYNEIEFRRSGCFAFDWVCGNHSKKGGLPRGQIVEIFGPEGCGKTTLAIVAARSIQGYKKNNEVGYMDLEGKMNLEYGYDLGMKKELLTVSKPIGKNRGEAAGKTMIAWTTMDCGLIAWDSFAATISKEESQGELTDANIGKRAMLQSKIIISMLGNLAPYSPTVLIVNQLRDNIGGYGASEKSSGAKALKYYAILRVDIRAKEKIEDGGKAVGQVVKFKVVKNQCSRPFLTEEIDMYFGEGYDNIKWCIDKAIELDIIKKKGSRYFIGDESLTRLQLTERFSKKKDLIKLYEDCVDANNLIEKAICEERRSKKGQASKEETDF